MINYSEGWRHELKFLLPTHLIAELRAAFAPHVTHDVFCSKRPDRAYTVRSVYYDSADLDFYFEKKDGFDVRKKLRIRTYDALGDHENAFIEIKRKHGRYGFKDRVKLPLEMIPEILGCQKQARSVSGNPGPSHVRSVGSRSRREIGCVAVATEPISQRRGRINGACRATGGVLRHAPRENELFTFSQQRVLRRMRELYANRELNPTLLVTYDREAMVGAVNSRQRVTFDCNMRSQKNPALGDIYSENLIPFVQDAFVLELKFDEWMPAWMGQIIKDFGLTVGSYSKYCHGIESCWSDQDLKDCAVLKMKIHPPLQQRAAHG